MSIKKIVLFLICFILLLGLVGCQAKDDKDINEKLEELGNDLSETQRRLKCYDIIESKADKDGNIKKSDVPYECYDVLSKVVK